MSLLKFKKLRIETYRPGKSKLLRSKNIVKLSANESALGVSPKVKKEEMADVLFLLREER